MMNYIKSEFYRIAHMGSIYRLAGILVLLPLLLNIAFHFFADQYANTSFSYSNFVATPMIFPFMGAIIAAFLYEDNRKNGNLRNTVSSGISRNKIFLGQCITAMLTSTLIMIISIGVHIVSAVLLLEKSGPVTLMDLLLEIPAVYLIAAAGVISSIFFLNFFEKSIVASLIWVLLWFIVPQILWYVGLRFDVIHELAMWMPNNFFGTHTLIVNTKECITLWDTAGGWFKCLFSGGIGVILFTLSGVASLEKKDL